MEKALRVLWQDEEEDQKEEKGPDPGPAPATGQTRRRGGPPGGAARGSDDQGPISQKGDGQEGARPTARLLSPGRKTEGPYREHGQALHQAHRKGQGEKARRVRGQGQQVPDRWDEFHRASQLRCLPRGQPFPGHDLQGPGTYRDQNEIGGSGCHLCHQQEPEVRHQIRYQDRFQEKGQGRQARKATEQVGGRHHQGTGQQAGGQFWQGQGILPPEKDKGTDQGHRGHMDILRYPYGQRPGDRQADGRHGTGKGGLGAKI